MRQALSGFASEDLYPTSSHTHTHTRLWTLSLPACLIFDIQVTQSPSERQQLLQIICAASPLHL